MGNHTKMVVKRIGSCGPLGYLGLSLCVQRPRMAPKLWRESYGAKGMHAFIDYHRSDILPSNVERLCRNRYDRHFICDIVEQTKTRQRIFSDRWRCNENSVHLLLKGMGR